MVDRLHHLRDLVGGLGGFLRQLAHLICDHGETTARFAGACGLDRSVQRQQVGLVGDAGNNLRELFDVLGCGVQLVDRVQALR